MKLLYVHDRFGAFAGAETNILATAQELKRRGWALGIVHGKSTGKAEHLWNASFDSRATLEDLALKIESFRPDALFVHNLADLRALDLLSHAGRPVIRMVHDHNLYCLRSYKYNYFTRRPCTRAFSHYCLFPCGAVVVRDPGGKFPVKRTHYGAKRTELELNRQFARVIVATRFMKQELVRNGFAPEKIEIHAPVPATADAAAPSTFDERNLILYSGQITRGKGVDVLLEALALVRVPFECLIFGDGNFRPHCEKLRDKLGLHDRVHFKGYVPPDEIARHYREASLALMSSVWPEPFGAAGLEGMRCGLPVVAFDVGGIREWLIDGLNGYLVPWMDRATYAARIEHLLRNKSLAREMGECARRSVTENFSFAKYVDGLEDLFTRVSTRLDQPVSVKT